MGATATRAGLRRSAVVAVVVGLVLVVVGSLWWRDHQRSEEWAHGGDDVAVTAQVRATDRADYPAALTAAGVEEEPAYPRSRQSFVVEVSWHGSSGSDGSYAFLMLDGRLSPPKPLGAAAVWSDDGATGPGWDGRYGALAEHYPWLARTAAVRTAGGSFRDSAEALLLHDSPQGEGRGVLSFYLPKPELPTSSPEDDLILAMVRIDEEGEVRWARRVPLT